MWLFALAFAADLPLPDPHPPPRWGRRDVAVGTAVWQVGESHRHEKWVGRVNVNATYTAAVAGRWRFGVHVGFQSVPYGPPDAIVRANVARIEPRFGPRLGSGGGRLDVDLALGVSVEPGPMPLGPVLSVSPKLWLGEARRTFLALEARLAPFRSVTYAYSSCLEWCDDRILTNPGGTGLLVSVGRSSPRVQAVRQPAPSQSLLPIDNR
ncbi:MAG: hypothetical protein H6737_02955 [Alphaproteobacteria bacterium]|nr:hypothetical protein [Alphaproteobacteria bacterium]